MAADDTEEPERKPWPIEPDHGMNKGPGYLGDAYHALRVREILKSVKQISLLANR